jgi:hypothetical protein
MKNESTELAQNPPFCKTDVMCRFSSQILIKMIEKLKELGFKIGALQDVTGSGLNTKEKIIYKRIPHYEKSFVYAYVHDLDTFFFGDSKDSEFFTLSVTSIEQICDLFKSLDYEKYL